MIVCDCDREYSPGYRRASRHIKRVPIAECQEEKRNSSTRLVDTGDRGNASRELETLDTGIQTRHLRWQRELAFDEMPHLPSLANQTWKDK